MKILFDQGTPVPLRRFLPDHLISTAYEKGWSSVKNGDLIQNAENEGFEALVTTDRNLKYQQNLSNRRIAIVVLLSTSWPKIQTKTNEIDAALRNIPPTGYIEIPI